jgi:predicted RNA binding protein YcfA (HicA-like mRNA interferase family)
VKQISWQELRDVCKLAGCVEARMKGDHLVMTKPGMARPVIIKMDKDLGEDLIRSNMRTLGLSRKEFERYLARVRGQER